MQIFGVVGLALDASVLEAKRKYNCDWMNQLTGYFDYTASAAFGFGIFAALISFLFGLIRTQRLPGAEGGLVRPVSPPRCSTHHLLHGQGPFYLL